MSRRLGPCPASGDPPGRASADAGGGWCPLPGRHRWRCLCPATAARTPAGGCQTRPAWTPCAGGGGQVGAVSRKAQQHQRSRRLGLRASPARPCRDAPPLGFPTLPCSPPFLLAPSQTSALFFFSALPARPLLCPPGLIRCFPPNPTLLPPPPVPTFGSRWGSWPPGWPG